MKEFEQAGLALLDRYLEALNARDSQAMRDCFHFPHYRFPGVRAQIFERAEDYGIEHFLTRDDTQGWAYTEWDCRNLIQGTAEKLHFEVQFTRYRTDHSVLGTHKSFWILIHRDNRWGVMARSSYAG